MNYRKKYKRKYGELRLGFEIHHIDGDRDNNDIENLVEIPPELHSRYHNSEYKINEINKKAIKHLSVKKLQKLRDQLFIFMTAKDEIETFKK